MKAHKRDFKNILPEYHTRVMKKLEQISLQNKKLEHTYCVSFIKYTVNSHIGSKTINNKVKLLKPKFLKCKHDKSMFLK